MLSVTANHYVMIEGVLLTEARRHLAHNQRSHLNPLGASGVLQ